MISKTLNVESKNWTFSSKLEIGGKELKLKEKEHQFSIVGNLAASHRTQTSRMLG